MAKECLNLTCKNQNPSNAKFCFICGNEFSDEESPVEDQLRVELSEFEKEFRIYKKSHDESQNIIEKFNKEIELQKKEIVKFCQEIKEWENKFTAKTLECETFANELETIKNTVKEGADTKIFWRKQLLEFRWIIILSIIVFSLSVLLILTIFKHLDAQMT